jgi:hypothetical protein
LRLLEAVEPELLARPLRGAGGRALAEQPRLRFKLESSGLELDHGRVRHFVPPRRGFRESLADSFLESNLE